MRLLSLDLSTKSSGWCVGQDGNLESHGCISASSRDVIKRIIKMRDQLSKIIKNNKIDKIIMEEVRPEYNSHTNKVLMWLQAVMVVATYQIDSNIEYEFVGASEWRAALKIKQGRGVKRQALKPQDIQNTIFQLMMMKLMLYVFLMPIGRSLIMKLTGNKKLL